jgi:hypothetical protein
MAFRLGIGIGPFHLSAPHKAEPIKAVETICTELAGPRKRLQITQWRVRYFPTNKLLINHNKFFTPDHGHVTIETGWV